MVTTQLQKISIVQLGSLQPCTERFAAPDFCEEMEYNSKKRVNVLTTLSLNSICGLFSLRLFNRACFFSFCNFFLSTPWSIDDARWSSMRNDCYANLAVKDRSACLENGHLAVNLHVFSCIALLIIEILSSLNFFLTFLSALF